MFEYNICIYYFSVIFVKIYRKITVMWYKEVTIKTNATREQIWNLWIDVENWKNWDKKQNFKLF